jgi:MATE family multidrug resistance protein
VKSLKQSWFFPNRDSFTGLWDYLKIGVPSAALLCLEWWSFELMTLLAGYISVEAMAAQVILLNISMTFFMIPLGI